MKHPWNLQVHETLTVSWIQLHISWTKNVPSSDMYICICIYVRMCLYVCYATTVILCCVNYFIARNL